MSSLYIPRYIRVFIGMKHLQCEEQAKELDVVVKEYQASSAKKQLGLRMLRDEKDREIENLYMTMENIKEHRERKLREKNKELHEVNSKVSTVIIKSSYSLIIRRKVGNV